MNYIKPIIGILLFVGVMSSWIFNTYNSYNTNEDALLEQKINKIDSRIIELKSELSFLTIEELNNITSNN